MEIGFGFLIELFAHAGGVDVLEAQEEGAGGIGTRQIMGDARGEGVAEVQPASGAGGEPRADGHGGFLPRAAGTGKPAACMLRAW